MSIIPLALSLSPAFAETATRRQAPGETGEGRLFSFANTFSNNGVDKDLKQR